MQRKKMNISLIVARFFNRIVSPKKSKKKMRLWKRYIIYLFWILPLSLIFVSYAYILKDLPSPTKLGSYDIPLSTNIYDRNGELLYHIYTEQNRSPVSLSQIPIFVRQATIAIEDKDFYKHGGINPVGGMFRATAAMVKKKQLQGGSTITQQLVKSALLTSERTVQRKIKEIILAFWVESLYSKDKILELYLNQVPYGGTAWGIQTAAEKYFGKNVQELTLGEAALLAGLPQAPTLYSPFGAHPDFAIARQTEVLRRMEEDGYISHEEGEKAKKEPIMFTSIQEMKAPHFIMYIKEQLVRRYGERIVEKGGLRVTTTLDLDLQEYAQTSVSAQVEKIKHLRVTNGAALITKPATGEILAMVGSRDYFASPSGSFNVTTALRQPGSSIKPINYAIGIENKTITLATMFLDIPTCFAVPGQTNYCPRNYDGKFHGPVQVRFALGNSYNIPAVKMLYLNNVHTMVASASAFGLDTLKDPSRYGLSLTLGGGEVSMVDMAEAFSVFANGGVRHDLVSILKVEDKNGKVIEEYKDQNLDRAIPSQLLISGKRVISPETAFLISHILSDNNARQGAFGHESNLLIPGYTVSVKTGTTDDLRDNWTIGFTPQYLVATWVGNNDNTPMDNALVSGITGAAPIFNIIMKHVLKGTTNIEAKRPDGIVGAHICTPSGLLPPNPEGEDKGCPTRFEYFIKGTVPNKTEELRRTVAIDKDTQDIGPPEKLDNIELQEHSVFDDGLSIWCSDCPHPEEKAVTVR